MNKISPCLWFDGNAQEAVDFYLSVFKDARIVETMLHNEASPGTPGSVLAILFQLEGEDIMALNGGPEFKFTPALSLFVKCDSQAEIDRYWDKLLEGGQAMACGWLTDRFGVTWQIAPRKLLKMLQDPDPDKANRTMTSMRTMVKLDLDELERAYRGA
ncbi:VOC family protein [Caballeronia sp. LP006]|uniref:VOC family protein n=1 Tax=unclassified Caballeronia TaxID=2646786 RepID=UPI002028F700|nr:MULTISPECIES: VOC family protein [unclassified Caballeronia]MDR5771595.1 VOC family protein [Caballeronia sp. LZ002]MDR5831085.1 VOC family protein [Caballeronia sp. LP006]MDR5847031.1 VOC family protein [Caballeronia sp. LZ003]